eukprot:CAMPEP_0182522058 /NCGR_PEP_ID=MMETSP1321-20130603/46439_1 /TAXON_ID=91990 /ORGANISM="Bolidomonas sp., Strain RCC1657" /LENGTH=357 /DNA_ID=CAMNT_0024730097 /DNA_START=201 /DNA_END=1271 /DNA_ORIENTATION=-
MSYQGLSEESTLILPFTTYLGMAGVIILPEHFFGESTSARPNPNPKLPPSSSSQPPSPTHSPQNNLDPELTGVISTTTTTTTTTTTSPNNTQHRHLRTLSVEDSSHSTQSLIHRQRKEKKKTAAQLPPFCLRLGTKGILCLMILADFCGTTFSLVGMQLCGSGLHTVVMSSTVCWAAILSYFILSKKVTSVEAGSLCIIMVGLIFSAAAQKHMGVVKAAEEMHGIDPFFKPIISRNEEGKAVVGFNNRDYEVDVEEEESSNKNIISSVATEISSTSQSAPTNSTGTVLDMINSVILSGSDKIVSENSASFGTSGHSELMPHPTDEDKAPHHPPSYYAGAVAVHRVWSGMLITLVSAW